LNHTLSAILRGSWLMEKSSADSYLPLVASMLKGESPAFQTVENNTFANLVSFGKKASVYSVNPYSDISSIPESSIVMVTIAGPLLKYGDYCSTGMVQYSALINRLAAADSVAGVILNFDSPGGQVSGTTLLADEIRALDAVKPVFGVVDDGMAASAGYWLISSCRKVFATKRNDSFGSIGVYTTIADYKSYFRDMHKLNIKDVYAPESTGKNATYLEAIDGNEEKLKADLSHLAQSFIEVVKTNRGDRLKNDSWNTGLMFYADEAKAIGLIDDILPLKNIVQEMQMLVQKSTLNMNTNTAGAFQNVLAAAKAESFAVVDGGFLATEENLNNIDAALAAGQQAAVSVQELSTTVATLTEDLEFANAAVTAGNDRILALESQVAELRAGPSGDGTVLPVAGDESSEPKKLRSYNDPKSKLNMLADKHVGKRSRK